MPRPDRKGPDTIRPNYYKLQVMATLPNGKKELVEVEAFDLIDAVGADKNGYLFNVWKYLFRLGRKTEDESSDIKKIRTYLNQYEERSRRA